MLNSTYLIDLGVLFGLLILVSRTLRLRSRGEAAMKGYKKGSAAYDTLRGALSTRRLVIIIVALVLTITKTIFDVRTIIQINGSSSLGILLPIAAFAALLTAVIFYATYKSPFGQFYRNSERKNSK